MNHDIIANNWKYLHGEIKKYWHDLTNDEIEELDGKYANLCAFLQEKYELTKDDAKQEINDFLNKYLLKDFTTKDIKIKSDHIKKKAYRAIKDHPFYILSLTALSGLIFSRLFK